MNKVEVWLCDRIITWLYKIYVCLENKKKNREIVFAIAENKKFTYNQT